MTNALSTGPRIDFAKSRAEPGFVDQVTATCGASHYLVFTPSYQGYGSARKSSLVRISIMKALHFFRVVV